MRITQTMLSNNMLRHLFDSQTKMDKYLTQTYTGKKITRPSDDPVIAMKGIDYRTEVKEIEQYRRNATEVWTWLDNSDESLDKATQVMHRLEELAVQATNDTLTENERASIEKEVSQLKEQMIEIANTNVNGKYIFNGTDMDLPRFNPDGTINDDGDNAESTFKIEVSKGIFMDANLTPDGVFDGEDGLMESIDGFIAALKGEDSNGNDLDEQQIQEALNESLSSLQESSLNIVNARAEVGARMNRLELVENRLEEQEAIAKEMMSNNEDIDFEEAVTNLITQETLHRAALSAGSRIIQPTLMDFLR